VLVLVLLVVAAECGGAVSAVHAMPALCAVVAGVAALCSAARVLRPAARASPPVPLGAAIPSSSPATAEKPSSFLLDCHSSWVLGCFTLSCASCPWCAVCNGCIVATSHALRKSLEGGIKVLDLHASHKRAHQVVHCGPMATWIHVPWQVPAVPCNSECKLIEKATSSSNINAAH
jgi:hypothetical protein